MKLILERSSSTEAVAALYPGVGGGGLSSGNDEAGGCHWPL